MKEARTRPTQLECGNVDGACTAVCIVQHARRGALLSVCCLGCLVTRLDLERLSFVGQSFLYLYGDRIQDD